MAGLQMEISRQLQKKMELQEFIGELTQHRDLTRAKSITIKINLKIMILWR